VAYVFCFFSDQHIHSAGSLTKQIQDLQKRNTLLSLQITELSRFAEENEKLKKALQFSEDKKISLIGADIIAFDPSSWRRIVFVNTGREKNLKEGMFVVDSDAVLTGRVIEVHRRYCKVLLIDDPEFDLPVFIADNSRAILKGGLDGLRLLYVDAADRIRIKDAVWCKFPSSALTINIGYVSKIKQDRNSLFYDVRVQSFSKKYLSDKVFIVK
jgi:cell shape-determining protein MreC